MSHWICCFPAWAASATKLIPIVIVTGSTRELDHLSVACVLWKPVDPDVLVEHRQEVPGP